jgi:hypothetical protein
MDSGTGNVKYSGFYTLPINSVKGHTGSGFYAVVDLFHVMVMQDKTI